MMSPVDLGQLSHNRGGCAARSVYLKPVLVTAALIFSAFNSVNAQGNSPAQTPEAILREAARDGVITDDEVYAYGCAIEPSTRKYGEKLAQYNDSNYLTLGFREDDEFDMDTLASLLKRSCKPALHIVALETGNQNAADYYLTATEFNDFYDDGQKTQHAYGLEKISVTWANTDSSSVCYANSNVMLSIRQVLQTPACYSYVRNHELEHARDSSERDMTVVASIWGMQGNKEKAQSIASAAERCFHTKEKKADAGSIKNAPWINVRGAYDFYIGAKPVDRLDFQKTLDVLKKNIPGDEHDSDLDRLKSGMLIAGSSPQ